MAADRRIRFSPRRAFGIGLAVLFVPLLGLTVVAASNGGPSIADVRAATAKFHDINAAKAAGYTELRDAAGIACIANLPTGTMGIHYVKGSLVGDGVINATTPEALVYEPLKNGKLKLVALEYVEIQDVWHGAHGATTPSVLGMTMRSVPAGNRYGLPAFFERHAWVWSDNPLGTFEDYSSKVSCGR
jgi:hypothetical protein